MSKKEQFAEAGIKTDYDLINYLKQTLKPQGSKNCIRLSAGEAGKQYFDGEYIRKCSDCLEQKILMATVFDNKLNPLEHLAVEILLSSADLI